MGGELPSMQLAEALLDGLPWGSACSADADHPQQEQDFDMSGLGLGEVLVQPDVNSAMGCSPAPQQGTVPAAQPAAGAPAQRKSEAHKVERIRAQNREASARYRQKVKVLSASVICMRCVSREFI